MTRLEMTPNSEIFEELHERMEHVLIVWVDKQERVCMWTDDLIAGLGLATDAKTSIHRFLEE